MRMHKTVVLTIFLAMAMVAMTANNAEAQTLTTLVNFDGANGNGANPMYIIMGHDGNLYGTTQDGGGSLTCFGEYSLHGGCGMIFKVTPDGTLIILHDFDGPDGEVPTGALVEGPEGGVFYGIAMFGGGGGVGTAYKITTDGAFTLLHTFSSTDDGVEPIGGLTYDAADGNFYGTSYFGGTFGRGNVFRMAPTGEVTSIYSFTGGLAGANPAAQLVLAPNGLLYGTTNDNGYQQNGVLYAVSKTGQATVLARLKAANGKTPCGSPTLIGSELVGIASGGGKSKDGTIYALNTAAGSGRSRLVTIYNFADTDGVAGCDQLVRGGNGPVLYGVTAFGGTNDAGTVFEVTPTGVTVVFSFDGGNGSYPFTLVQSEDPHVLYGTTYYGGTLGMGTIFCLKF